MLSEHCLMVETLVNTQSKSAVKRLLFGNIIKSPPHPLLSKVFIPHFINPSIKKKKKKSKE